MSTVPAAATVGNLLTLAGKSEYCATPTNRSCAPAKSTSSVACGDRVTMRCAGLASCTGWPAPSVVWALAKGSRNYGIKNENAISMSFFKLKILKKCMSIALDRFKACSSSVCTINPS
jgi:hypothetical protein